MVESSPNCRANPGGKCVKRAALSPFGDTERMASPILATQGSKTVEKTLLRRFEASVGCLTACIAVPTGDGHPGRGCRLAFCHPSPGRFPDARLQSVHNDGGDSPPPFWATVLVASCVHRRPLRRWTERKPGLPRFNHRRALGSQRIRETNIPAAFLQRAPLIGTRKHTFTVDFTERRPLFAGGCDNGQKLTEIGDN